MISPKNYYHNAARDKVVEEGDKDAKFLIAKKGAEIPDALAKQYGISTSGDDKHGSDPKDSSEKTKTVPPKK